MLARSWRAALLAAAMVLSANAVRADGPPAKGGDCCKEKKGCQKCPGLNCELLILSGKKADCCQNGQCGKAKECCKDTECCKGKCGACGCCCTTKTEPAKKTAFTHPIIIMVPMPMMTAPVHPAMMPQVISSQPFNLTLPMTPPMPPQSVAMPVPPPPPIYNSGPVAMPSNSDVDLDTCLSVLGMVADVCFAHSQPASIPSMCVSALGLVSDLCSQNGCADMTLPAAKYVNHPPQYMPPSPPFPQAAVLPPPRELPDSATPPTVACGLACPAATACASKIHIRAMADDGQLEMSIGDDACMTCKKMIVKVGGCALTMTTADGKVRIRSAELKGWADCVQTDRKERLILKGDAVLHYKKDGQITQILAGEHIELNLATGSVRIEQVSSVKPAHVGEAILYYGTAP